MTYRAITEKTGLKSLGGNTIFIVGENALVTLRIALHAENVKHVNRATEPQGLELFDTSSFTVPGKPAVFHKRPPGRPKGPRGFVFSTSGGARVLALRAVSHFDRANRCAMSALIARRYSGPRSAYGRLEAANGRFHIQCAFASLAVALICLRGGVL